MNTTYISASRSFKLASSDIMVDEQITLIHSEAGMFEVLALNNSEQISTGGWKSVATTLESTGSVTRALHVFTQHTTGPGWHSALHQGQ